MGHFSDLRRALVVAAFALGMAAPALAAAAATAVPTVPTVPTTGYRAEYLTALEDVQGKLTELAGAVPAGKYSWRPGEGVRSVAEVYAHLASGNYFIPTMIGVQAPANVSKDLEKETDKTRVIATLKASIDHVRQAILKTSDADLEKKVKMFGRDASEREVFSLIMNHMHEHLGQSIAYARMCGVVPPWTAREQQPKPAAAKP
jgi:uncharacterized damage-inducible protein DinB